MPRIRAKGIFCLEGDWDLDLRYRTTLDPVLQLLERSNQPNIPYIRRDIGTAGELEYYLAKWVQLRYTLYPILYLGFHGGPGFLHVGDRRENPVDLEWLGKRLAGRCEKRIIHFGSCGTMATHGNRINQFLEQTGALAVCGYKKSVDWMLSAAFEIILLSGFQANALTRPGMRAVEKRMHREAARLARDLAFRMVIAP